MTYAEELRAQAEAAGIPAYMHPGLVAYITIGRPVGDFLTAVLSNDLRTAVNRADHQNRHALPAYVAFLQSHAPDGCWGSAAMVAAWRAHRGLLHKQPLDPDIAKEEDSRREEAQ
jgi:hypothetical protein